jgi:hypothetical protein
MDILRAVSSRKRAEPPNRSAKVDPEMRRKDRNPFRLDPKIQEDDKSSKPIWISKTAFFRRGRAPTINCGSVASFGEFTPTLRMETVLDCGVYFFVSCRRGGMPDRHRART